MRILLVDDHAMFRHSLAFLLSSMRPDAVIEQSFDVDSALRLLGALERKPDLALLDLHVSGRDPLAGLIRFRTEAADVPVVVVSADETPTTIHACIELGAFSYVPKSADVEDLTAAIDRILGGGVWLPRPLLVDGRHRAAPALVHTAEAPTKANRGPCPLVTERQKQVLWLVVQGQTNKMIGKALGISDGTVKTHLAHLMSQFGVSTRTQLVFELARSGMRMDDENPSTVG